ncbi:MAG: peptidase M14, partial [Verrucomicrobia bacterium]|nr:peptidase M14 [Verrucomicrobiota bacterium]
MEPVIDCDFPGGNIIFEKIEGDTVFLHQDLRDTTTDWFYWYFRIRNAGGRNLKFVFTKSRAIGMLGSGISRDNGLTWTWTGKASIQGNSFSYSFSGDENDIRFSFGMPYTESNLSAFLAGFGANRHIRQEILCRSSKGRNVELVRFGCLDRAPRFKALITCRHHCCEMMASYVVEGII